MAEAPHGTAPALEGKDVANPLAMILACAAVLHYAGERGDDEAERASPGRSTTPASRPPATASAPTTSDGSAGTRRSTTEFTVAGQVELAR